MTQSPSLVDPVHDYASMSLMLWRHAGHTDAEIHAFTEPNPVADEQWEASQRRRVGVVYAPPLEVKAHIRQLMLADAAAAAA